MKDKKESQPFTHVDIGCECVLFFRLKKPIDPVKLVKEICIDAKRSSIKKVRYTQRLIPVSMTDTASEAGLERLSQIVLKPEFHAEEQQPLKFAIRTEIRNHHILDRKIIIPKVAETVGNDHGHKVDLKEYDRLIIVNCFKSSLGIAVVDGDFESLNRYNLQQIFEESVKKSSDEKLAKDKKEKEIEAKGDDV